MALTLSNVLVKEFSEGEQKLVRRYPEPVSIQVIEECEKLRVRIRRGPGAAFTSQPDGGPETELEVWKETEVGKLGQARVVIEGQSRTTVLEFGSRAEAELLSGLVRQFKFGCGGQGGGGGGGGRGSTFSERTEEASASQYFQFYGYLSQQQNMMQDFIRTSTYQKAILSNGEDFRGKVVLDVGAGSGILSFFAVQAGARKVYAVEASSMARHAEELVHSNKLSGRIVVIPGKIEEVLIPEPVDIIISEPMGYMLFNERMLETYLHAKKWLGPAGGRMFPSRGDLHIAPFSDAALFMEQLNKANFWYQENFHGVNLSALRTAAVKEYFRQPVVDTFDVRICMAKSHRFSVDFQTAAEEDLHHLRIPFSFVMLQSGEVHGLAFWFDVAFVGSSNTVWLSTAPTQPLTHWYQVRCLVDSPLFLQRGQTLSGRVCLRSNKRQSYDVDMELAVEGTTLRATNSLDLKNPYFRYTGQPPTAPPGSHETSPSEQYWAALDSTGGVQQQQQQTNGGLVNGNGPIPMPPSSIGGGISPALFQQQPPLQTQAGIVVSAVGGGGGGFPVSSTNLMIEDYVLSRLPASNSAPAFKQQHQQQQQP